MRIIGLPNLALTALADRPPAVDREDAIDSRSSTERNPHSPRKTTVKQTSRHKSERRTRLSGISFQLTQLRSDGVLPNPLPTGRVIALLQIFRIEGALNHIIAEQRFPAFDGGNVIVFKLGNLGTQFRHIGHLRFSKDAIDESRRHETIQSEWSHETLRGETQHRT